MSSLLDMHYRCFLPDFFTFSVVSFDVTSSFALSLVYLPCPSQLAFLLLLPHAKHCDLTSVPLHSLFPLSRMFPS